MMDLMRLVPNVAFDNQPKPVIKHECKQEPPQDEVKLYIPGNSLYAKFLRWFTRIRILSPTHHYAQTCLKSSTAIRNEINRHLHNHPYIIHPFSPFRNFWDLMMTIVTIIVLFLTPFLNAFLFHNPRKSLPYLVISDCILLFDVMLLFITGHFDHRTKIVTLEPHIIANKYLRGYFFFDLLSALPVEMIDNLTHEGEQHESWYCSTFNYIKIFRVRNLIIYLYQFHKSYHISFRKAKFLEVVTLVVISIHWATCLVYYIPMLVLTYSSDADSNSKSWLKSTSMAARNTNLKKYILSMNRALTSLVSSTHYLNVSTAEDMIVNFVLSVFGKFGFIYVLAQLLQLITNHHSSEKERLRLLQQLQEYMQHKELPSVTQKRLLVYCNYWYKKNFNRDKRVLAQVSEPLREELILHNYMRLLKTVEFFEFLPQPAIIELVNFVKSEIYLASDTIVKAGTQGDSLYFVGSGTVAVYTSFGKEVCHLEDGSYFGEMALVMENEQRVASVVAIETCEILVVTREAFQQVVAPYGNLLSHLQKIAFERIEKTLLIDEFLLLSQSNPNYVNISNIKGKRRTDFK